MLEAINIHARYETASILHGVTLSVHDGESVALLGRNGMGKTTLLRAIVGLRPPTVTAGEVKFSGTDLLALPSYKIAQLGVGVVPQGRRVFASLTVEENLRIAARPKTGGWHLDSVYEFFPRLGERRRQSSATLSGGEQQMLAIGRAVMANPRLLVMDEPSEGLAPAIHEVILDRMRALKDTGLSVLMAEQNVDFALELADHVLILGEGGVVTWSGTSNELHADTSLLHGLVGLTAHAETTMSEDENA